jgi:hypothetical protein
MNKQQLIEKLESLGFDTSDILNAKAWSTEKKEGFVEWACANIQYLSSQASFNKDAREGLNIVTAQYNLYLIVINEA